MFNWLMGFLGFRSTDSRGGTSPNGSFERYRSTGRFERIKAKYDAASTQDARHWQNSDQLSAKSANHLAVRTKLRSRARYEIANNCHAMGIVSTLANDVIGTGPALQILLDDEGLCNAIEQPWNDWYEEINLAEKLHTFERAKISDGEGCGRFVLDETLYSSVRLNVEIFETDRMTDPFQRIATQGFRSLVDGIELDDRNRPTSYYILTQHPGDTAGLMPLTANEFRYTQEPARNILHFFRADRPEQYRGIPEITPALPLFAQIRRYTLAVLAAAEIAADFAAFIKTNAPAADVGGDNTQPRTWDTTDIEKGMLTVLPHQWEVTQMRAEQPTTTHDQFVKSLLREACHALLIPYNIANADFEGDSYAGGRMALQVYQRSVKVTRAHLASRILNKIFAAWYEEAIRVPNLLPSNAPQSAYDVPHCWHYDAWGHVDPVKESTATGLDLQNGSTTLAEVCAEDGKDWRDVMRQRAAEMEMATSLGLNLGGMQPAPPQDAANQGGSDATSNAYA